MKIQTKDQLECGSVKYIGRLNRRDKRLYAGIHLASPSKLPKINPGITQTDTREQRLSLIHIIHIKF